MSPFGFYMDPILKEGLGFGGKPGRRFVGDTNVVVAGAAAGSSSSSSRGSGGGKLGFLGREFGTG